jgi:branched-chain amino acid transport system substrate-binding protein
MPGAGLVRRRAASLWALALAALALAVAGCGTQSASSSSNISGSELTIYASQPAGAGDQVTADTLDAEHLAFDQGSHRVGKYTIAFQPVHGAELSDNARTAISDNSAIAYLGELVPGTSGVSVQINNEEGLLEVSPLDTAIYLTQPTPAVPGAPSSYYPERSTNHATFARVVPSAAQEAKVQITEMHSLGLTKLYISSDGSPYGASLAQLVRQDASSQGLTPTSSEAGADAVFYGGMAGPVAAKAIDQAATSSPSARLFVPSALYDQAFVAGLSAAAQKNLYISSPGFASQDMPASARRFETLFQSTYRHAPAPQAIFGYVAMQALLSVLSKLGSNAGDRAVVVSDFRALKVSQSGLKVSQSALGAYSIVGGDTNIAPFIFGRPQGGKLVARPAS